jgi:3-methyladenine DNA glycosylase AlkD
VVRADDALIRAVREALAAAADPARAAQMQRYMKSTMPYYGVPAPASRKIFAEVFAAHPLPDRPRWLATVQELWDGATHREEWYAALALTGDRRYAAYNDPGALPLYAGFILVGAWWDVVDETAARRVGPLLRAHPEQVRPEVRAWITAPDRWLRRASIICQLGSKDRTDIDLLTAAIDANAGDKDFFLRKGIGWALRQHAKTDPEWVRGFVAARRDRLSPLSVREATKHL